MRNREGFPNGDRQPQPYAFEYTADSSYDELQRSAIRAVRANLPHFTSPLLLTGESKNLVTFTVGALKKRTEGEKPVETPEPFNLTLPRKEVVSYILEDFGLSLRYSSELALSDYSGGGQPSGTGRINYGRSILAQIKTNALRGKPPTFTGKIDRDNLKPWQHIEQEKANIKPNRATAVVMRDVGKSLEVNQRYKMLATILGIISSLEQIYDEVEIKFFLNAEYVTNTGESRFWKETGVGGKDPAFLYDVIMEDSERKKGDLHVIHFGSGEAERSGMTLKYAHALAKKSKQFLYAEIPSSGNFFESPLMEALRRGGEEKLVAVMIKDKDSVKPVVEKYLRPYLGF